VLKSMSTSLILRGILATIVGILALAWPGVTILALIILFAVYAFVDAGFQAMRGFTSGKAGPAIGHLLLGLIDVGAGVVALAWPAPTALVLVLVVAFWAVFGGFSEVFAAFGAGEDRGPARGVPPHRCGVDRVWSGAVRPPGPGCGDPRHPVRAVQPLLRGDADHEGHRRPPDRASAAPG
jgi:hypothetical protein